MPFGKTRGYAGNTRRKRRGRKDDDEGEDGDELFCGSKPRGPESSLKVIRAAALGGVLWEIVLRLSKGRRFTYAPSNELRTFIPRERLAHCTIVRSRV